MIYIILEEEECEDFVYKPYENIIYVTNNKEDAYNYFNNCNGEGYNERYILREYKNTSKKYDLEIFKYKNDIKLIESMDRYDNEQKQLAKKLELKKIQDKTLIFNDDDWELTSQI